MTRFSNLPDLTIPADTKVDFRGLPRVPGIYTLANLLKIPRWPDGCRLIVDNDPDPQLCLTAGIAGLPPLPDIHDDAYWSEWFNNHQVAIGAGAEEHPALSAGRFLNAFPPNFHTCIL